MESKNTLLTPFDKQQEFINAVFSGKYTELLYGGGIRGGKSYVSMYLCIILCRMYPGSRWAIVRKNLPTLKKTTIPTFKKIAPTPFVGKIHRTEWAVDCTNGSQILFFPASTEGDPDLNRWRGLEVNGFFLEEVNEIPEAAYFKAIERAGTWTPTGTDSKPPPLIISTCNPTKNWVKSRFYDKWMAGDLGKKQFYLPALADENPYIDDTLKESWKSMPEAEYRTFVLGDWDSADDPHQLITWEWINRAFARGQDAPHPQGRHFLGVDVARFGNDASTIAHRIGNHLLSVEGRKGDDIAETSARVAGKIHATGCRPSDVMVDTVGLGAGVFDILKSQGMRGTEFIAGAKATGLYGNLQFRNIRSEMWWHLRELFRTDMITLDPSLRKCTQLIEDLTAPHYKFASERLIEVEGKDAMKKRIGRSTDYGDAVMQCFAQMSTGLNFLKKLTNW